MKTEDRDTAEKGAGRTEINPGARRGNFFDNKRIKNLYVYCIFVLIIIDGVISRPVSSNFFLNFAFHVGTVLVILITFKIFVLGSLWLLLKLPFPVPAFITFVVIGLWGIACMYGLTSLTNELRIDRHPYHSTIEDFEDGNFR
jgi:xanthosine utilization system XapX-like protein